MTNTRAAIATAQLIKTISIGIRHLSDAVAVLAAHADEETKAAIQAIFQNMSVETQKLKAAMEKPVEETPIDEDNLHAGFYL